MQQQQTAATARTRGERELQNMLMAGAGRTTSVTTPDPAQIDYLYDFSSIFATPEQQGFYTAPYANARPAMAASAGGVVNSNAALLRLLGGK